jgi:hypothetical protein
MSQLNKLHGANIIVKSDFFRRKTVNILMKKKIYEINLLIVCHPLCK